MSDLDTIRERHYVVSGPDAPDGFCVECFNYEQGPYLPCDTRVVLDALEKEGRLAFERKHEARAARSNADDFRADADRLAEALRAFVKADDVHTEHMCSPGFCNDLVGMDFDDAMPAAREALRQHEEMK